MVGQGKDWLAQLVWVLTGSDVQTAGRLLPPGWLSPRHTAVGLGYGAVGAGTRKPDTECPR